MTSFISTASCSRGARVRARWSSSRSTWTEPRPMAWTSSPMIQRRWGTVTIYHPTFKTLIFMHFWILNQQLHTSFPSYQTTETEIWNVMSINLCRRFCIPSRVIIKLSSNLGWPSLSCHVVKHKVCSKAVNEPSQSFTVARPVESKKRKVSRREIGTLFHKDQNKCLNLTFTYVLFLGAHLTLCLNRSLVVKSLYKEISKA